MQKRATFPQLELSGTKLQYVRQFNYLGVKLDSRLTFESHANECIHLVSHKKILLTKIRTYIDKKQALTIYKSKILPYFDYGGTGQDTRYAKRNSKIGPYDWF